MRSISDSDEEKLIARYHEKLAKKVSKINTQVLETGMERARLILEDRKKGRKSAHKTWWECTEQEFRSPDPSLKVRVTDHEKEE